METLKEAVLDVAIVIFLFILTAGARYRDCHDTRPAAASRTAPTHP